MPAPIFTLALSGTAPDQRATKEQLEDGINAGFRALFQQTEVVSAEQDTLGSEIAVLSERVDNIQTEVGDGIVGATTRANLFAMTRPAGTIGRVYQDSNAAYNGDYVSTGTGWTYVGADRIGKVEAATAAPLCSFSLPLIHDPWGLKSSGTQTIYVPRQVYVRRGLNTVNGSFGTASSVFSTHVALSVTASSATIYIDLLDGTNPFKVASFPTLPPMRPDTIIILAEIYQYRLKTEHANVKLEDPDKENISFRWPIIVDGTKVRFGPFYHFSPTTLWTLYEPTAPESYWEFDLNTLQTSQWRYYFDREAAEKGLAPIKVANSGTTRPLAIDGRGVLLEIGTAINQHFSTNHPVIGGAAGVPNMLPLGNDPDRATRYDASDTTAVPLTDAALIAMGMTRGFGGTYPMPRLQLPPGTLTKGWMFHRVAVQFPTDNAFEAPTIYLKAGDGRNLAINTMLMEKRLSARAAIYVRLVPYDVSETPTQITVGYTGAGRITAGHQYYVGPVKGAIASGDFAISGVDDILFPPTMYAVSGRELPIWRDGVVPDRANAGHVAIYTPASVSATEAPYIQQIVDHAVVGDRTSFTLGIAGDRGRPSFRASRSVNVIRRSLPLLGSVSVLALGDSITNRELPARIHAKLAAFGMTPTMLGTMANEGGQSGEGRGSWEYADFVGMDSQFSAVPIGGEAAYLAKSAVNADPDGRWNSNPFLRPSTGSDPAGSIFNGLIFDFPAYLSRFSIPVPGFVTLNLGTNDINLRTPAVALDQITKALAIMVPSILAASSTIRVGVGIPTLPRSELGDGKWNSHMVAAISAIMAECAKHSRADVVPIWAHMSPDFGWPVTAYQTRAGRICGSLGDELHPIDLGRSLMAEADAQWIACRSA